MITCKPSFHKNKQEMLPKTILSEKCTWSWYLLFFLIYSCLEFQRVLTRSKSSSFSQQPVKSTKFALRIHLSSFTESSCTSSTFLISLRLLFREAGGAEGGTLTIKKNSKLRAPYNHLAWWTLNPLHPNISIHILHTLVYTFHLVLTRRICSTIKGLFVTLMFLPGVILQTRC